MESYFKYTKVLDVKSPARGTDRSAGIDFYIPNFSYKFLSLFESKNSFARYDDREELLIVPAHTDVLIPSGLHIRIPEGTALIANNKSGVALRKKLTFGASVVDNDYEDMMHLHLFNLADEPVTLMFGEKIIQFLLTPILFPMPEEVASIEELYEKNDSSRKGGFGSTGIL